MHKKENMEPDTITGKNAATTDPEAANSSRSTHQEINTEKERESENLESAPSEDEISFEELSGGAPELRNKPDENPKEDPVEKLTEQLKAGNDKYLRLMAEFDNYKRRTSKEYEKMVEYANEQLVGQLIEVRDNFERALDPKNIGADTTKIVEGVRMIYSKFEGVLQRNGLKPFGEPGEEFNPELHDAMMKIPDGEIAEDHIVQVFEKGYTLKEKIIKHAKVIVSQGKPANPQNADGEDTVTGEE